MATTTIYPPFTDDFESDSLSTDYYLLADPGSTAAVYGDALHLNASAGASGIELRKFRSTDDSPITAIARVRADTAKNFAFGFLGSGAHEVTVQIGSKFCFCFRNQWYTNEAIIPSAVPVQGANYTVSVTMTHNENHRAEFRIWDETGKLIASSTVTTMMNSGEASRHTLRASGDGARYSVMDFSVYHRDQRPPSAPGYLNASANGIDVALTWHAPGDTGYGSITGYDIWRATDAGPFELAEQGWPTKAYNDTECFALHGCQYKVRAVNIWGAGPNSTTAKALPGGDATGDWDDDTLLNGEEVAAGTNLRVADTDEDLLNDYQELIVYGTAPLDPDSDGDGLSDGSEVLEIGSNPLSNDTDADGLADLTDPTPTRESIPPRLGGSTAIIVLDEAGYIEFSMSAPPEEPGTIRAVTMSGRLTVETDEGEIPAFFTAEGVQQVDGGWKARWPVPPGVDRVTNESIRIIVVDTAGNAWASYSNFTHVLNSNRWSMDLNATAGPTGFEYVIHHASAVEATEPMAFRHAYILPVASPPSVTYLNGTAVAIAPSAVPVRIASGPSEASTNPRSFEIRFATEWRPTLSSQIDIPPEVALRARSETASFFFDSSHPAANGATAGDTVAVLTGYSGYRELRRARCTHFARGSHERGARSAELHDGACRHRPIPPAGRNPRECRARLREGCRPSHPAC